MKNNQPTVVVLVLGICAIATIGAGRFLDAKEVRAADPTSSESIPFEVCVLDGPDPIPQKS